MNGALSIQQRNYQDMQEAMCMKKQKTQENYFIHIGTGIRKNFIANKFSIQEKRSGKLLGTSEKLCK